MADDRDFERTEPASQRRLEEARAQGQVARSPELSNLAVLFVAVLALTLLGASLSQALRDVFAQTMTIDRAAIYAPGAITAMLASVALSVGFAFLPLLLIVLFLTVGSALLLGGWTFAPGVLAIDLNRINPLPGARRALSTESLYRLFKQVFKALLFGTAIFILVWLQAEALPGLVMETAAASASALVRWLGLGALIIVGLLGVVAVIDAVFSVWTHRRRLRMTRAEVLQEYRESEGAPEAKARIRARQRQVGRVRQVEAQEPL